jgi:prolyl-tRNA editing enzyme YbaK/EbsC (Cys-tRNA(Pro) deacylase)
VGKGSFNLRLAPEAVSDGLSGYTHNAVTPIGMATRLPIVLSHRIAGLSPDLFWLGAGETDLKVGLRAPEFVAAYADAPVFVADVTFEHAGGEGGEGDGGGDD